MPDSASTMRVFPTRFACGRKAARLRESDLKAGTLEPVEAPGNCVLVLKRPLSLAAWPALTRAQMSNESNSGMDSFDEY